MSSENRGWIPGRFYDANVIAGNKLIIFPDAEPWHAALLQSSIFMAWVSVFVGRLKSDISISPALAYFPVPWPEIADAGKAALAAGWADVEEARGAHPDATLADLYGSNSMPQRLLATHHALDGLVDRTFAQRRRFTDNAERLSHLISAYAAGTAQNQLTVPSRSRRA
ncbi:hypothetical protein IWX81_002874 [Salinibacterium sp. CAN_S4]